ncbi:restriction endonuclease subunit S [Bacteroides fragilis]|jgi:type I restriction enzyme S subunit|uniref:restriction endonuclease subunit S n=2 Tax=Bacteroidia TaxID=200643 RepID=UPI0018983239|nr:MULTISPECIES: restriction endonuclease subunit S [Bacteroides]MDA1471605.1 restriction endonuclease subunit S [Bacteroides fragilis]MDA1481247.1 restriction endonuclease subunit S [Bacteroides fragilis]MDC2421030.1 restriction endonuclease subunit S [Bacteroides ovatus]
MELKKYKKKRITPQGWKEVTLADAFNTSSGATPLSTEASYYENGTIPWINSGELASPYIYGTTNFISQAGFENSSTEIYPIDTVLVAMYGATAGKASLLKMEACTNQAICAILPNKDYSSTFLKYSIDTLYDHLVGLSSGSARDNLSQAELKKLKLIMPPTKDEQNKLVSILALIDRKIELNRAINQNLEAMAKQLYDYWFVQFDFPDENGQPYKSSGGKMVWNEKLKREIPKGWNVAKLTDEIELQYGFPFSTDLFTEQVTSVPVVRIRDILDNSISAYTTEEVEERYLLQKQDLLIGMDGNFHINYWTDNVSYLNQRSVRLRAKNNSNVSIVQAKYDIQPYIKAKETRTKGSTVGHLSDKDMKELYVLVCPNEKAREKLDSILSMIVKNRNEVTFLIKQRNELLPLLMNGQIIIE